MKNLIRVTTIAILLIFVSCSDDTPDSQTFTQRVKGDLYQEVNEGSVISIEKTKLLEGLLKQDECWQMSDIKIVMTNETYDTMNASITANGVTVSLEASISASGETLNIKLFDSETVVNYDYRLLNECFKS